MPVAFAMLVSSATTPIPRHDDSTFAWPVDGREATMTKDRRPAAGAPGARPRLAALRPRRFTERELDIMREIQGRTQAFARCAVADDVVRRLDELAAVIEDDLGMSADPIRQASARLKDSARCRGPR